MRKVGKDIEAVSRWEDVAKAYADAMGGGYHLHRLSVIKTLLPDLKGKTVVDFGCGEGVLCELAVAMGAKVIGIDPVQSLLDMAEKRAPGRYIMGGVNALGDVETADCVLATNVLAYLSDWEHKAFYEQLQRVLKPGGSFVVTHSNELFDIYTFNAYTVNFYREHFGVDVSSLVANPTKPNRPTFNVRENPLAYPEKLKQCGLEVERIEYMNWHHKPPLLTSDDPDDMQRDRPDTLTVAPEDRWKLMFQCSMFGVRARRT